ncbi:MAG TPA: outer membrane beta-barrel protein [Burkholderiaceae bacterium]|nr:outer membrane beta-barrel protein [Burkholderiaceae bacterium]
MQKGLQKAARAIAGLMCAVGFSASWAASDLDADLLKNGYFGVNGGRADYTYRNPPAAPVDDLCDPVAYECNSWAGGWKLYGGYMIRPYFGIEAVAFRFGDVGQKYDLGGGLFLNQSIHIHGYGLVAVGELPLGRVELQGRAGYAAVTAVRTDEFVGVVNLRSEKTRAEPLLGVGIGVRVWQGLRVRVDGDYTWARTEAGEKFEATFLSLGVAYRF